MAQRDLSCFRGPVGECTGDARILDASWRDSLFFLLPIPGCIRDGSQLGDRGWVFWSGRVVIAFLMVGWLREVISKGLLVESMVQVLIVRIPPSP